MLLRVIKKNHYTYIKLYFAITQLSHRPISLYYEIIILLLLLINISVYNL